MIWTYIFQAPLDLNEFRSSDADALPLLHFILHIASLKDSFNKTVLNVVLFLREMMKFPSPFFKVNPADGLDCTLKSSSGQKAGEMFPRKATEVLCCACHMGDMALSVVEGMLAAGTDVNQCDEDGRSPLWYASYDRHIDIIDVLFSHAVNVSCVKKSLILACERKQWLAAIALHQYIVKVEADMPEGQRSNNDEVFLTAVKLNGVKFTQYLAENDRRSYNVLVCNLSLSDACKLGYDLVVKHHTLYHNCSQNHIVDAVKIAQSNNQSTALRVLMPHLTNSSVSELITHAYQLGQYSFAHELFESCTDHSTLPPPGISITDACKARQIDLVEFLIKHGKDVNKAADELGYLLKYVPSDAHTLLHVLKASAEDNQIDDNMYNPVKVSVSLSAVNDHNCHPPLVYACMQGDIAVVKLLLQHGADVNICSDETPLTAACKHGHAEIVDILLCKVPSPSICSTNMYGMTPLQVAVKNHQGEIARKRLPGPNACNIPDTELIEVTLTPQQGLPKSFSIVKLQALSQSITDIVHKQPSCWKIFLDPIKTEDTGTLPIVAAFQSNQYNLVKFFIERSAKHKLLFECSKLEDICQLESVFLVQQFIIYNQLDKTQINYKKVLDMVVKLGNTDLMTYFLTHYQICSGSLENAMLQACQQGSQDMLHLLIQHDECLVKSIQHDSSDHCQHPLCIAIRNSDSKLAVILYKSGARLFNVPSGETSLHNIICEDSLKYLCSRQDEFRDILPCLLPECIDPKSLTSALIAACEAGCTHAARLVVSRNAHMNGCDEKGNSPLCAAIKAGSSQLVTLLLTAGANPNKASCEYGTALHIACKQEHYEISSKLIDARANTNPESCSVLRNACEGNFIDIVELLLENNTNPNQYFPEGHIINIAHNAQHYEVVRLLLEYGAEPSGITSLGLKTVCELGYTEVAQHIIHTSQVSPDVLEQCVEGAYKNGFLESVLEAIMDISEPELTNHCIGRVHALLLSEIYALPAPKPTGDMSNNLSLWQCLGKRNIPRMRELIKAGHNVNVPNATGRSMMQECILQGITHIIPDLCASEIDIDYRDSAGRTALFYSLASPYVYTMCGKTISVFEFLVSKGADVNVRDHFGRSVLHEWQPASDGLKHGPSLETLLKDIDINSTDHKGQTPLHLAVLENNISAVRQLLEHGANMEIHDINDITPLFLAHNNHAMLRVLQEDYPEYECKIQDSPSGEKDCTRSFYMLRDKAVQHRLIPALKEIFHERAKYSPTGHFMSKYEARVYYVMKSSIHEEKLLFEKAVLQMLQAINTLVIKEEPVLSFTPRISGSCAEGTKVIALDEADMLCIFDDISWKDITLSRVSNDSHTHKNSSFVQITSLSTKHQALLSDGFVSKRKLLQRMYSLIRKALPTVLKNINSLYMVDVKNSVANDHSLACLSMVWHCRVLPWQEFTMDIVPAIPITQEQLPDATRQVMNHPHIMQDLFVVPKTGTFDQSQNDTSFRLSFSSTERDMFIAMPPALKQGYMLTKVLNHDCITIDDIPWGVCSYNLKTATFNCFKSESPNWEDLVIQAHKTVTVNPDSQAVPEDVVKHAHNILQEVEHSFAQTRQDSFFLKRCDLMVHSIDKNDYRPMLCVKYCAAMLSDTGKVAWQQLAECVVRQLLNSKNMHESCFLHEIETLLGMGLKSQINSILDIMIRTGQVEGVKMMLKRGASAEGEVVDVQGLMARARVENNTATSKTDAVLKFLQENLKGKFIINLYITSWGTRRCTGKQSNY